MTPASQLPLVSTIGERCRVCYQCVRECPAKAIRIVKIMVKKAAGDEPLETIKVEVKKKALVLGGGVAGIGPFQMLNTDMSVIFGMTYGFLPFTILPLYVAIDRLDPSLVHAARDLDDAHVPDRAGRSGRCRGRRRGAARSRG